MLPLNINGKLIYCSQSKRLYYRNVDVVHSESFAYNGKRTEEEEEETRKRKREEEEGK